MKDYLINTIKELKEQLKNDLTHEQREQVENKLKLYKVRLMVRE